MSTIKMPQAFFEAGANLQKVMKGAGIGVIPKGVGIGVIPTGVDMETSPPTVTFSTSLDVETGINPTPLLEIPNLSEPKSDAFSARAAFFGDGTISEENPSFLNTYRKWQQLADEEVEIARSTKGTLSERGLRKLLKLRIEFCNRLASETTDPDAKAEFLFCAGVAMALSGSLSDPDSASEIADVFGKAMKFTTNPDAQAMLAELAFSAPDEEFGEMDPDKSCMIINSWQRAQRESNDNYDAARLFTGIRWAFTPTNNIYNMYYLLRDHIEGNDVYAADNLIRAVWAQLKWHEIMNERQAGAELDSEQVTEYADVIRVAIAIWKKDTVRASHVAALEKIVSDLKEVAQHIDDEHEGTFEFDIDTWFVELLDPRLKDR